MTETISVDEVARFLVGIDYGIGLTGGEVPLPRALRLPLAKAWRACDTDGPNEPDETVQDYYDTLAVELGWDE